MCDCGAGPEAQEGCRCRGKAPGAMLMGIKESAGLRQQIKVLQIKSGFGGRECLLPFSKQMEASWLLPRTSKIWLVPCEAGLMEWTR